MTLVERELAGFIAREILAGRVTGIIPCDALLLQDGIIDSLGLQKLLVFLEEEFAIRIGEDDLVPENFESIAAIAKLVDKLRMKNIASGY